MSEHMNPRARPKRPRFVPVPRENPYSLTQRKAGFIQKMAYKLGVLCSVDATGTSSPLPHHSILPSLRARLRELERRPGHADELFNTALPTSTPSSSGE